MYFTKFFILFFSPGNPCVALEIVGESALRRWRSCIRPSVEFNDDSEHETHELNFRHSIYIGTVSFFKGQTKSK